MFTRISSGILLFLIVLLIQSCSPEKEVSNLDSGFNQYIESLTHNVEISRIDPVMIIFNDAIVSQKETKKPLDHSPISFTPPLEGVTAWEDEYTLIFTPTRPLRSGERYQGQMKLADIIPEATGELKLLDFSFRVMEQDAEILPVEYLINEEETILKGTITYADTIDQEELNGKITAKQGGKKLDVTWEEEAGKISYRITGIDRKETDTQVNITWNLPDINKRRGSVTIPGVESLKLLSAKHRNKEDAIELVFSDAIDKTQILDGLITTNTNEDLNFSVTQNRVMVFGDFASKKQLNVTVVPGIKSRTGTILTQAVTNEVQTSSENPSVKILGQGNILPRGDELILPIETVNLKKVIVEVSLIHGNRLRSFISESNYSYRTNLYRFADPIWRKVFSLEWTDSDNNRRKNHGLDLTPLARKYPLGMYSLKVYYDRDMVYHSGASPEAMTPLLRAQALRDPTYDEWDNTSSIRYNYRERRDPEKPAFYRNYSRALRNVVTTDLGIMTRRDRDDHLHIAVASIQSAEPVSAATVEVFSQSLQSIWKGKTQVDGTVSALIRSDKKPFMVEVVKGRDRSLLPLANNTLSRSNFDTGGASINRGIKGFIYGERGVWRPGNTIHLNFILEDPEGLVSDEYPVKLTFYDSRGQLREERLGETSVAGFYRFDLKTAPSDPTGNWRANIFAGGTNFSKTVKVETIMPNRLTAELNTDQEYLSPQKPLKAILSSRWLHGAPAKNLKAKIYLSLAKGGNPFDGYEDYTFQDPVRNTSIFRNLFLEATLDEEGNYSFEKEIKSGSALPGPMSAIFTMNIFEPGGAFSTTPPTILSYRPYDTFTGFSLPKADIYGRIYSTEEDHPVSITLLDSDGNPLNGEVNVRMYEAEWSWWWDVSSKTSAYRRALNYSPVKTETITVKDGKGLWNMRSPHEGGWWRQYLIRFETESGHISGTTVRFRSKNRWNTGNNSGEGPSLLFLATDKKEYAVGERVKVMLPPTARGKYYISLENNGKLTKSHWISTRNEDAEIVYTFTAEADMTPNLYLHAALIQPFEGKENDRPLRMYGVIPIKVTDSKSRLVPEITTADTYRPESTVSIDISEKNGQTMGYTVAVVDEGLLSLTGFRTPNPWNAFFGRERSMVSSSDLYDHILSKYGGSLDQLLAIGGGGGIISDAQNGKDDRFPPVVRFLGPFTLAANAKATHTIDLPNYVGKVRVMVVAGKKGTYGSAEKSVPVKAPLMVLGTFPRIAGTGEEIDVPVSVFAMEEEIKDVQVSLAVEGSIEVDGEAAQQITFAKPGEETLFFRVKTGYGSGPATLRIKAVSNQEVAEEVINVATRHAIPLTSQSRTIRLEANTPHSETVEFFGFPETREFEVEVSRFPPINLSKRLKYLVRYPYGCLEQTTSSVFPQLYLTALMPVKEDEAKDIQNNIKAGIKRLERFQRNNGSFAYWPGGSYTNNWAHTYATHFLIEAKSRGYYVPPKMFEDALNYLKKTTRSDQWDQTTIAYRHLLLAISGNADLSRMNALKESGLEFASASSALMGGAYFLSGQKEAGEKFFSDFEAKRSENDENNYYYSYGSSVRNRALELYALSMSERTTTKAAAEIAEIISNTLGQDRWLSTQSTAFSLLAMAKYAGISKETSAGDYAFAYSFEDYAEETVTTDDIIHKVTFGGEVPDQLAFTLESENDFPLFAVITESGVPEAGKEEMYSENVSLEIVYKKDGAVITPDTLNQGDQVEMTVKVTPGNLYWYNDMALSVAIPAGWEIVNQRLNNSSAERENYTYRDIRDDRIDTFFSLQRKKSVEYTFYFIAAYRGRFYRPGVRVEEMYNEKIKAGSAGSWTVVE